MSSRDSSALTGKPVLEVLDQVAGLREQLRMRLHGEPPTVFTRIREVYPDKKSMQIEAFQNGEVDRGMRPGDEIEGAFFFRGLQYHFTCHYRGAAGIGFHRLSTPQRLDALQRRETFRVAPPPEEPAHAMIRYDEDKPGVRAEIEDLSIGGARLVPGRGDVEWAPEMDMQLQIVFSDVRQRFSTKATIRHIIEPEDQKTLTVLGVQFAQLPVSQESFLGRLVMHWQREHVKREREMEMDR